MRILGHAPRRQVGREVEGNPEDEGRPARQEDVRTPGVGLASKGSPPTVQVPTAQPYVKSLSYGVTAPVLPAVHSNLIETGRQETIANNPNIICYNCETPGDYESRCWKSRVDPEIRAEHVQRINANSGRRKSYPPRSGQNGHQAQQETDFLRRQVLELKRASQGHGDVAAGYGPITAGPGQFTAGPGQFAAGQGQIKARSGQFAAQYGPITAGQGLIMPDRVSVRRTRPANDRRRSDGKRTRPRPRTKRRELCQDYDGSLMER